ncbi:1,4-dihydroxy-2-naphthoate polyprenyltransferase [Arcanobacterium pinnipediorum]|uniref:1,4-dihydroxy-2-naphthoate octaprenyltransferase n=1 Tax=Arcanobacterium pinnipediorum TaxID=1503041 RepID=A0ABY5AHS6_9ACTO|nr:1,4-dihydroxy-2-naphthoate polyprenyltransferase [Arcanobacterium pinnipediorum]USR79642.1 1,4-dihydroxy-2-naphthoate polyprenyltransferase [Arcanobacterium pinnipediorum]
MATLHDWLEGARVRTLPAALAPVIIGAGLAFYDGGFSWVRTLLAGFVALAFQVGVNFSNDYSDGIRGTDDHRQGPPRLTGGGKVSPRIVLMIAIGFFVGACVGGLALVALSGQWWLIALGLAAVAAAWFYTGGKHPYGYLGLGEIFVLVFFGWMATVGTAYVQTGLAPWYAWAAGTGVGLIACALLMVNNIRDIPTDSETGKRTLAVRLGDKRARDLFALTLVLAVLIQASVLSVVGGWFGVVSLVLIIPITPTILEVRGHARGRYLIPALKRIGIFELAYAVVFVLGFALS